MIMKNILFVCVNYNSYSELERFLFSIDKSFSSLSDKNVMIEVFIADNSTKAQDIDLSTFKNFTVQILKLNNLGYLGGAAVIVNGIENIKSYDYVIISNVDLTIDASFIPTLLSLKVNTDTAWIAPSIFSQAENRDKNPKVLTRYPKRKLQILQFMYRFPIFHKIYTLSLYKTKKKRLQPPSMDIYAGHGAFMIFTKKMLETYPEIKYPIFLFGEELYFAEIISRANLKVRYEPSLKVYDEEHVSTSTMKSSFYYKCNLEALTYILHTYYE